MTSKTKTMGAVAGSVVLLGSTAFGFATVQAAPGAVEGSQDDAAIVASLAQDGPRTAARAIPVQGTFSFDQDATSAMDAFARAASALCSSLPKYEVPGAEQTMRISKQHGPSVEATVSDLRETQGVQAVTMACACASNIAGGGAVANAGVEGVALESVVEMMGK